MQPQESGRSSGSEISRRARFQTCDGDSFVWERSSAKSSRCFLAPTKARLKGCSRWKRKSGRQQNQRELPKLRRCQEKPKLRHRKELRKALRRSLVQHPPLRSRVRTTKLQLMTSPRSNFGSRKSRLDRKSTRL